MRWLRVGVALTICAGGVGTIVACSPDDAADTAAQGSEIGDREDIFDKSTPLEMNVSVPLTTLFTRYKNGDADPPDPTKDAAGRDPWEKDFSEPAKVTVKNVDGKGTTKTLDARIYIRGESSRRDCPFPKLKIDFGDKEQLKGTVFKGHSKLRMNTHCGPGGADARSGMGRIQNAIGPVREELIYRLIRAAEVPTYLTRIAKVSYDDTSGGAQSTDTFAMLFETGDDAVGRFIKEKLVEPEAQYIDPSDVRGRATADNLAMIDVAEAIGGNRDYGGTHNVDTFGVPAAATVFQIPQDFDLCAITTAGAPNWSGAISAASRGLTNATVKAHFADKKAAMVAAIAEAEKDGIAAGVLESNDGKTTTDQGFAVARDRIEKLFQLPELAGAAPQ